MRIKVGAVVAGITAAVLLASPVSATLGQVSGTGDIRISGPDRFATSAEISNRIASMPQHRVYVASADSFPDALAAGPLAAADDSPILLVARDSVPQSVAQEIRRLGPEVITIVGGPASVSPDVQTALQQVGGDTVRVERLAGPTRYDTASVLTAGLRDVAEVFVVSGEGFADALAAGPAAALRQTGIVLTAPGSLPAPSAATLQRLNPAQVTVVGGPNTVNQKVLDDIAGLLPDAKVARVSGQTRYATAAELVKKLWPDGSDTVFLASGLRAPDALAGTPAAALSEAPILLTQADCHPGETAAAVTGLNPSRKIHLGGPLSIYMGDQVCGQAAPKPTPTPKPVTAAAKQLTHDFDPPSAAASRNALEGLTVAVPGSMSGYSRTLFPHWRDADRWGWPPVPNSNCDVRQAALYREGTGVTYDSTCKILSGSWLDPYTAVTLNHASDVDIDHIVPLAEAWRTGAATWTVEQRTRFANDKLEVIAVHDKVNASKGDKTPDLWKPPHTESRCLYAQRWVAIKASYGLTVNASEKNALNQMIDTCEG